MTMSPDTALLLRALWTAARLPESVLGRCSLPGADHVVSPSSFKVGQLAQASIASAALIASCIHGFRDPLPDGNRQVTVAVRDAVAEFRIERLATLNGQLVAIWDSLAGTYKARDGYLRPHTNWAHHRLGLLRMLGLPDDTGKETLSERLAGLSAVETAERAMTRGLVLTALRSFDQWDVTEHARVSSSRSDGPVRIGRIRERPPKPFRPLTNPSRPLDGVRVLDLTRVIAGPTAGRTLAGYGADVLWITAPHLPSLVGLDFDTSRGKRTTQLDLRRSNPADRAKFEELVRSCDVVLQSYRPGGLASLGYGPDDLVQINPDLVYASLSAWGTEGPWSDRKGFDSLVQFAVGINEAEGMAWTDAHGGEFEPRALPCQALDHASGYLLAFGIQAALFHRAQTGGAYQVETSLLEVASLLRSLGRVPVLENPFEVRQETLGDLRARGRTEVLRDGFDGRVVESLRHAADIQGCDNSSRFAARGYRDVKPGWADE